MAKVTIAELRKKWGSMVEALMRIRTKATPGPFQDSLESLLQSVALEKSLNNFIILDKDHFPAPKLIGLLRDLGVTPELIKERALADGLINARVLDGELLIDEDSVLTDDNMVQLIKVLLYKDYEGESK